MGQKEGLNQEENQGGNPEEFDTGINKMFDFVDEEEQDDAEDLSEFEGLGNMNSVPETTDQEEEEEEDPDELDFTSAREEEQEEEEEEGDDDIDLEAFNKKMDTDFKTKEDLKDFLKGKTGEDTQETEVKSYEKAKNNIDLYEPIVNLDDESLMREEFKAQEITRARKAGEEVDLESINYTVEQKVQDLIDSNVLDLRADKLRKILNEKFINPAKETITAYDKKQEDARIAQEKSDDEKIQNKLAEIYKNKNFYGITPEKDRIAKAYKKVSSGKFIQELQSNKEFQAEVATVVEYLSEIGKKAGGPTHSDGVRSVLEDFESKQKKNGDGAFANAQKRGTAGGGDGTRGLLADILYEASEED